jgi:hypothetical protein
MAELYHTIYTHKELNPDLLIALFLLKEYGDQKYPGIHQAHIEILDALPEEENGTSLEYKGIISFGFNDGLFIATESRSYSQQIANTLGLADGIAVETFISIAEQKKQNEHGDFYIILNGIIEEYSDKPNKTLKASYPVLKAHFDALQEELAPIATEYMNKLNAGEVMAFVAPQKRNELRVIAINSNNPEMAQFLHNQEEIQADVVCQKYESGHVSITTRYQSHANLDETIAILRIEEARKKKLPFDQINWNDLRMEDRMEHLEEWKYDKEEQTIFNTKALGKPNKGATLLELKDLKLILQIGLDKSKLDRKCPPVGCRGKKCKFYFYNLDRCQRRRKNKDIDQKKSDLKSSVQVLQDDAVVKLDD